MRPGVAPAASRPSLVQNAAAWLSWIRLDPKTDGVRGQPASGGAISYSKGELLRLRLDKPIEVSGQRLEMTLSNSPRRWWTQ